MTDANRYRELLARLRSEARCYPDDCEYCSAEGKCKCQRIGEACDAIEELLPYYVSYLAAGKIIHDTLCLDYKVEVKG